MSEHATCPNCGDPVHNSANGGVGAVHDAVGLLGMHSQHDDLVVRAGGVPGRAMVSRSTARTASNFTPARQGPDCRNRQYPTGWIVATMVDVARERLPRFPGPAAAFSRRGRATDPGTPA